MHNERSVYPNSRNVRMKIREQDQMLRKYPVGTQVLKAEVQGALLRPLTSDEAENYGLFR